MYEINYILAFYIRIFILLSCCISQNDKTESNQNLITLNAEFNISFGKDYYSPSLNFDN
jgi:hypothetical protein